MDITQIIRQIDWQADDNRITAESLISDAAEYMRRVEGHIYKGNEIRADSFMSVDEKQDEIRRLDSKRTEAHDRMLTDRMLTSFSPFLDLLRNVQGFKESDYNLSNRTRIADFIALIAFELTGVEPASRKEGDIRDELAEKLHRKEVTLEQIIAETHKLASE